MAEINEKTKEVAYKLWCTNDIKSVIKVDTDKVESYNNIPVYWCNNCKSLYILNISTKLDKSIGCYCGKCYSTSIHKGNIKEWLEFNNKTNKENNGK